MQSVAEKVLKFHGMELLGIIPKDTVLAGLFVSEIAEELNAEFVVEPKRDRLVLCQAVEHFKESKNAILVTGGDRADLQIVALEVPSIRCLLLTGNVKPAEIVVERAEENDVPIMLVEEDTLKTVARLEEVMRKARIKGELKIKKMKSLIENYVNVGRIIEKLGLENEGQS